MTLLIIHGHVPRAANPMYSLCLLPFMLMPTHDFVFLLLLCNLTMAALRTFFSKHGVDTFFGAVNYSRESAAVLSGQARTVRGPGPDGPRVRRGGRRSPTAPGSRSREGPRRGGEILGFV
jgi:hypothetical protein